MASDSCLLHDCVLAARWCPVLTVSESEYVLIETWKCRWGEGEPTTVLVVLPSMYHHQNFKSSIWNHLNLEIYWNLAVKWRSDCQTRTKLLKRVWSTYPWRDLACQKWTFRLNAKQCEDGRDNIYRFSQSLTLLDSTKTSMDESADKSERYEHCVCHNPPNQNCKLYCFLYSQT